MSLWLGVLGGQATIPPPSISYDSVVFLAGSGSQVRAPTVTGGSGTKTFSYSGSLPSGFSFNTSTGAITGPAPSAWRGATDTSFTSSVVIDGEVKRLSSGKLLVHTTSGVQRFNSDGSVDTSWTVTSGWNSFGKFGVQPDGKTFFNTSSTMARYGVNGAEEATFTPIGPGAILMATLALDNGKLVVGGDFADFGNDTLGVRIRTYGFGRINSDFTPDSTLSRTNNYGALGIGVSALAKQSDGKVVLCETGGGTAGIRRLDATATTLDSSFTTGVINTVYELLHVQPDDKIVYGGNNFIGRVNSNGSEDTSFAASVVGKPLYAATLPDGKILIGGSFSSVNGVPRTNIALLNSDGSLSYGGPTSAGVVTGIALTPSNQIIWGNKNGNVVQTQYGPTPLPSTIVVSVTDLAGTGSTAIQISAASTAAAPGTLTAVGTNSQIALSWVAPTYTGGSPITGYTVSYSASSASGPWTIWSQNQPGLSATIAGLTTATQYWVKVEAANAVGTGTAATASPITYVIPGTPTGLTATTNYKFIDFAWTAPASTGGGVQDYILQRSPDNSTWSTISDGVSTAVTYRLSGLGDGETVFFRVAASNGAGGGAYTSSVSATTLAPKATGGTITYVAPNFIHTFTASGTLTSIASIASAEGLVAAGGYAGTAGTASSSGAGGGGATVSTGTQAISTTRTITVGGVGGGTSSISGWLTATGQARAGGAGRTTSVAGGAGTTGVSSSITGTAVVYASSGGGGGFSNTTTVIGGGAGGTGAGSGGSGRSSTNSGRNGAGASTYGSGGGGGGALTIGTGGAGRQGVVIIRYPA